MSTTATKPRRPLRLSQKAELIPAARFVEWHRCASATAGLTSTEMAILAAIAAYYRQLAERGYAGLLSYERLAEAADRPDVQCIKGAVRHLVELALLGIRPGSGQRPNQYLPALPRKRAASPSTAAAAEELAPPF